MLDAGCGSGRITEALIERLPRRARDRRRRVAVDGRRRARAAAGRRRARGSTCSSSSSSEPVDAILSTATFHWIADHERLFARLRAALRPGGRLVAQCGGEGNIDVLRGHASEVLAREPYAEHFAGWRRRGTTPGPSETERAPARRRLRRGRVLAAAGAAAARARRASSSRRSCSARTCQQLPAELREPFMDDVLAELGEPVVVDYVRLNIDATA